MVERMNANTSYDEGCDDDDGDDLEEFLGYCGHCRQEAAAVWDDVGDHIICDDCGGRR